MKTNSLQNIQWLMTIVALMISFSSFSQRSITWKGGTPGMKNDWFCPQNWSSSSVPDEFSDVIIPDVTTTTFTPPVIRSGDIEINSLYLHSNSSLTISSNAVLRVNGHVEGVAAGKVKGPGQLIYEDKSTSLISRLVAYQ